MMLYLPANKCSHGKILRLQGDSGSRQGLWSPRHISLLHHTFYQSSKSQDQPTFTGEIQNHLCMEGAGTHIAEGADTERSSHLCYIISTDTMLPLNVMNFQSILSQVFLFSVHMNPCEDKYDQYCFLKKYQLNKSYIKHEGLNFQRENIYKNPTLNKNHIERTSVIL